MKNDLQKILTFDEIKNELFKLCEETDCEMSIDGSDNIIIHKSGSGRRIVFPFICGLNQIIITSAEKNKADFRTVNSDYAESLGDREVFFNDESIGIIRNENNENKEKSVSKIELWEDNTVKTGDVCFLKTDVMCKGDKLYGFSLTPVISMKIIQNVLTNFNDSVNDTYFTVSFYRDFAVTYPKDIKPEEAYPVICAKTDKNFVIDKGCGILIKDGCHITRESVISRLSEMAEKKKITVQNFIGKSSPIPERLSVCGGGIVTGGLYLPVSHMGSGCEIVSDSDINSIVMMIKSIAEEK